MSGFVDGEVVMSNGVLDTTHLLCCVVVFYLTK